MTILKIKKPPKGTICGMHGCPRKAVAYEYDRDSALPVCRPCQQWLTKVESEER